MNNFQPKTLALPHNMLPEGAEKYFEHLKVFQEMMMRYQCAILEVQTKLQVLNNDMSVRYRRNPIEFVKTRIKSPQSIAEKLNRRGLEISVDNMVEHLNDVAGVRVVCSFIDDIYEVAEMLARQSDINVLEIKDYIKNPKENGYRSYHMIIEIPVFFSDKTMNMRVEIQIRTIAMDFWASLEHDLHYKNDKDIPEDICRQMIDSANEIAEIDLKMQEIFKKIQRLD